jgi:hypothetical protein
VSHGGELFDYRRVHLRMRMAEAKDGGTAGAVEVALAGGVEQVAALSAHDARQFFYSKPAHCALPHLRTTNAEFIRASISDSVKPIYQNKTYVLPN